MREARINYEPRELFVPYHTRHQRWACIVAHRRFGKTVGSINDIVAKALYNPLIRPRYGYIAPYYSQAKQIAWDYLKHYTEEVRVGKPRESELSVELVNGAVVRLYGADNPDALRGIYLDGVLLDEPAQMHPRIWTEVLRPALADRRGWATFIGTPKGHNFFYEIWQLAQEEPEEWFSLLLKASETGILSADELRDARRLMSDDEYEQEFECNFEAAVRGAYYGKEMVLALEEGRIGHFPYNPDYQVQTCWDIGNDDSTVIWFFQEINGFITFIDVFEDHHADLEDYVTELGADHRAEWQYQRDHYPHDMAAKFFGMKHSALEQMAYHHKRQARVIPKQTLLNQHTQTRRLFPRFRFNHSTENDTAHSARMNTALEALKLYRQEYDRELKKYRDKPVHDWTSHYASALHQGTFGHEPSKLRTQGHIIRRAANRIVTMDELWAKHDEQWAAKNRMSGRI